MDQSCRTLLEILENGILEPKDIEKLLKERSSMFTAILDWFTPPGAETTAKVQSGKMIIRNKEYSIVSFKERALEFSSKFNLDAVVTAKLIWNDVAGSLLMEDPAKYDAQKFEQLYIDERVCLLEILCWMFRTRLFPKHKYYKEVVDVISGLYNISWIRKMLEQLTKIVDSSKISSSINRTRSDIHGILKLLVLVLFDDDKKPSGIIQATSWPEIAIQTIETLSKLWPLLENSATHTASIALIILIYIELMQPQRIKEDSRDPTKQIDASTLSGHLLSNLSCGHKMGQIMKESFERNELQLSLIQVSWVSMVLSIPNKESRFKFMGSSEVESEPDFLELCRNRVTWAVESCHCFEILKKLIYTMCKDEVNIAIFKTIVKYFYRSLMGSASLNDYIYSNKSFRDGFAALYENDSELSREFLHEMEWERQEEAPCRYTWIWDRNILNFPGKDIHSMPHLSACLANDTLSAKTIFELLSEVSAISIPEEINHFKPDGMQFVVDHEIIMKGVAFLEPGTKGEFVEKEELSEKEIIWRFHGLDRGYSMWQIGYRMLWSCVQGLEPADSMQEEMCAETWSLLEVAPIVHLFRVVVSSSSSLWLSLEQLISRSESSLHSYPVTHLMLKLLCCSVYIPSLSNLMKTEPALLANITGYLVAASKANPIAVFHLLKDFGCIQHQNWENHEEESALISSLKAILRAEKDAHDFATTEQFLLLISNLYDFHRKWPTENYLLQEKLLFVCFAYLQQNIFPLLLSWKVSLLCMSLIEKVIVDITDNAETGIRRNLIISMLNSNTIRVILDFVGIGSEDLKRYMRGHFGSAQLAEQIVATAMKLLENLLVNGDIRKGVLRKAIDEYTVGSRKITLIRCIAQYNGYLYSPSKRPIPLMGAKLLRLLSLSSVRHNANSMIASLAAQLGDDLERCIGSYHYCLSTKQPLKLKIAIVDLMTEALEAESAFAEAFLTGPSESQELSDQYILPQGLVLIRALAFNARSPLKLRAAATRFMDALWRRVLRYRRLVEGLTVEKQKQENDVDYWKKFWHALIAEMPKEKLDWRKPDLQLEDAYRYQLHASLLRIITSEAFHLTNDEDNQFYVEIKKVCSIIDTYMGNWLEFYMRCGEAHSRLSENTIIAHDVAAQLGLPLELLLCPEATKNDPNRPVQNYVYDYSLAITKQLRPDLVKAIRVINESRFVCDALLSCQQALKYFLVIRFGENANHQIVGENLLCGWIRSCFEALVTDSSGRRVDYTLCETSLVLLVLFRQALKQGVKFKFGEAGFSTYLSILNKTIQWRQEANPTASFLLDRLLEVFLMILLCVHERPDDEQRPELRIEFEENLLAALRTAIELGLAKEEENNETTPASKATVSDVNPGDGELHKKKHRKRVCYNIIAHSLRVLSHRTELVQLLEIYRFPTILVLSIDESLKSTQHEEAWDSMRTVELLASHASTARLLMNERIIELPWWSNDPHRGRKQREQFVEFVDVLIALTKSLHGNQECFERIMRFVQANIQALTIFLETRNADYVIRPWTRHLQPWPWLQQQQGSVTNPNDQEKEAPSNVMILNGMSKVMVLVWTLLPYFDSWIRDYQTECELMIKFSISLLKPLVEVTSVTLERLEIHSSAQENLNTAATNGSTQQPNQPQQETAVKESSSKKDKKVYVEEYIHSLRALRTCLLISCEIMLCAFKRQQVIIIPFDVEKIRRLLFPSKDAAGNNINLRIRLQKCSADSSSHSGEKELIVHIFEMFQSLLRAQSADSEKKKEAQDILFRIEEILK